MKRLLILGLLGLGYCVTPAQAQDDDFKLLRWNGGTVQADLELGFNLSGAGIGTGTLGGVMSPRVSSGATSLFSNPAELGWLKHRQVTLGSRFRIGTSTFNLSGSDFLSAEDIAGETDSFLEDLAFPEDATPTYTDAEAVSAGLSGRLASFGIALPVHERLVFGMGLHQPVTFGLNLGMSGVEALLQASQQNGDQTIDINFLLNVNAGLSLDLQMNALSFGFGGYLAEGRWGGLSVGAAVQRYQVSNRMQASFLPEGMVVLSGSQEYFFNDLGDPNLTDGETNAFYLRGGGSYKASVWGARAGLVYDLPLKGWHLSVAYNHIPTFTLEDPNARFDRYLPVFINLDGSLDPEEGEAEMLDVGALSLAKPNLTEAKPDTLGSVFTLSMPSSLTLGLDVGLGPHTVALNYVHYSGELSLAGVFGHDEAGEADAFKVGKRFTTGLRAGIDLKFPDRMGWHTPVLLPVRLLFLDIDGLLLQAFGKYTRYRNPRYRIGGGIALGSAALANLSESREETFSNIFDLPLPTGFSLGRQYTVLDGLDVGVMLFGVPDLAFRVGLAYNFQ